MRVLFVHPRFPGPFRSLAACLGAVAGNKVLFLAERHRRELVIPGVRRILVPPAPAPDKGNNAEREILLIMRRGANMANAMLKLQRDGFWPDIICHASGSGCGFYAADVYPDVFKAVYADWFQNKGATYTFFNGGKARLPEDFAPWRMRNLCQYNALGDSEFVFTSTQWQKSQFPPEFRERIHVLHQGVDTDFFSPAQGTAPVPGCPVVPDELVTFTAHELNASRGFPQFAASLPLLLTLRPRCHVVIMATQRAGSGEQALPPELRNMDKSLRDRVHFPGFRPLEEYRQLLRASSLHVYLSAPFALSSGLLEAMSCGCLVLGSDTEPVREVITHGRNGALCAFHDGEGLARAAASLLAEAGSERVRAMREAARAGILAEYDSRALGIRHFTSLLDALSVPRHASAVD